MARAHPLVLTTFAAFVLAAGLTLGVPSAAAQAAWDDQAVTLEDGYRLWFVELPGAPTSDGGDLATIQQQQQAFRDAAARAGLKYRPRRTFSKLWNGISIAVDPASLGTLQRMEGLAGIYPVVSVRLPETQEVADPALLTALAMTGADVAQNELGLTGAGVKVGLIDTGVDYDHPDLGGDGVSRENSTHFPNARVIGGYDFVGDDYNGTNEPSPDPYPDDCYGHGTHVAGILGASGLVRGVAPGVQFEAYRVFGCSGSTPADILIAAMERALDDGVQIVNMSLGTPFEWPDYPSAQAANRLVNRGVVVCASIGNDGTNGVYSGGAPGLGEKVIGVGSFDNTFTHLPAFSVTPDNHPTPYTPAVADPLPVPPPVSGTQPLARTSMAPVNNDACQPLPANSLAGHVALIALGTCGAYTQARNAEAAGALAVVLYNNGGGGFAPDVQGTPPVGIPVVGIGAAEGLLLRSRLEFGPVSLTWGEVVAVQLGSGGQTSFFSSFGLSPDLTLKPDLGAPGGFLRSTLPIEQGSYGTLSGTSMSSPHVAGAVALLLQARPNFKAQNVRGQLMNYANPAASAFDPAWLESSHHQGAGLLDIPDAIRGSTRVEPEKLSLGESESGPVHRTLTIHNDGAVDLVYDLSHQPALATGPFTFFASYLRTPANVQFDHGAVFVPAHGSATFDVTITPDPAEPLQTIYGGYLVVAPEAGHVVRVPYAGFCGDYQSLPALTIGGLFDLPWLAQKVGRFFTRRPNGATYTMAGEDVPFLIYHLDHQASLLRIEVFDAVTGRAWHRAFERKHVPRSALEGNAAVLGWNGVTSFGKQTLTVPNGDYILRMSALRALGDASNPAHWDVWNSPVITIARPGAQEIAGIDAAPGEGPLAMAIPSPNPSSGAVSFRFRTPQSGAVTLDVFDISGRRLRGWHWDALPAGDHLIRWDGADERGASAPAGAILCRLTAPGGTLTRTAVRLR